MYDSEDKKIRFKRHRRAFSLMEIIIALAILAAISSSVLVVMRRCITSAMDSRTRAFAFELARENMEKLLASSSVVDTAEFGTSETNPDIEWQTVVKSFYEPVTSRMWIEAVCSASYTDSDNQRQTIELTCWLTDVTKEQMLKILDQQQRELENMSQIQYEELIAQQQGLIREYLAEARLDLVTFDELIISQKQERLAWLDDYEYDSQIYYELIQDQQEEQETVLTDIGFDRDEFTAFAEGRNLPYITPFSVPVSNIPSINSIGPQQPNNKSPGTNSGHGASATFEDILIGGYTRDEFKNLPLDQAWEVLGELLKQSQ